MVVRLQSSLGRSLKKIDSEELNVKGLLLGTVSKINYKYQTVEVKINSLTLGHNPSDDGKLAVPYPKDYVGRTPEGSVYGSNTLITEGTTVLLGFINDDINYPIILAIYGNTEANQLINTNPLEGGKMSNDDVYKYSSALYSILPDLTYTYKDGEGTSIKTFNGKSFLSITSGDKEKPLSSDFYTGTEYQDLFPSYYSNKNLIEPRIQKAPNMLFKHQGLYFDDGSEDNHVTTLFISEKGDVRASVLDKSTQKRTTQEMSHDGSYRVIKQDDDLLLDSAQVWVEFGINDNNVFYIKNPKHMFEFNDKGIYLDDKPILDTLDASITESIDRLKEVQKELDDINYLLEGVGKENLEELIQETKKSIEVSSKASSDVTTMKSQISNVSSRAEGIITQFQEFRDKTFKGLYEDASTMINKYNQEIPELKSRLNTLDTITLPNINNTLLEKSSKTYVNNSSQSVSSNYLGSLLQLDSNLTIYPYTPTRITWNKIVFNNSEFVNKTKDAFVIPLGVSKVKVSINLKWDILQDKVKTIIVKKNSNTYKTITNGNTHDNIITNVIPVKQGDTFTVEVQQDNDINLTLLQDNTMFSIEVLETTLAPTNTELLGTASEQTDKQLQTLVNSNVDLLSLTTQVTKDNQLVCLNDSKLDTITTGKGNVSDYTLQQIKSFSSKNGESILSLEDVLAKYKNSIRYSINLPTTANIVELLKKYNLIGIRAPRNQVYLKVKDLTITQEVLNNFSNLPVLYNTSYLTSTDINKGIYTNIYGVLLPYTSITQDTVNTAHNNNLSIYASGDMTSDIINKLILYGIDGVETNKILEFKKV
ncbi:glycerophosphoryl diester phosphodiesterase [Staphylococcus phage vB_SauM_Remus]|uniref:Glycerophosphoryl diester phosphodiesterase n=5 Tax=Silviavirus remus TaxID=1857890 RepID=S4T8X8_9CAUD|nr:glycerophosphoryl diester phosphodiesterase [Staphylococcus phage vB_SauM_Romulus]YP_008431165.1 glycerophosphoryl diester phosphodiesterase [Staphylococcus phage vB_SauM_Remus]QVD57637.1 glycerophosphoryl diester phosphodiesterase [Staphylococcus phage PM56]QVD58530.1 glycerophosphoryl diester phosphodiesterase [Staphylococcus phage PM93]QVD58733.1 glycerophosphoryl diester phosphodiesterase [Silviavirus remus]QVD58924.1 glycerophosphoryl diester phosphodiesterase [Staphylococcus phage Rom